MALIRRIACHFRPVSALLVLLFVTPSEPLQAADYHWPTTAPPALTSSFGEYRAGGRLHAGIDLKTWGREGYPVLGIDDGYVWRVRTSPWGYGRAVYLRLADGRTAVYAHLSAFSPDIRALVESEQERRGTFSVNLFLKPGQIPVHRGETLGYSGRTGTVFPHLHFELRDEVQKPMNVLLHGLRVEDTVPPIILALAFIPLDADARVSDRYGPRRLGVTWDEDRKRFVAAGPVPIEGRVGVAVDVFDRADASALTNRLAPFRLRLLVDGREVFRTTYTSFGFDQVSQVELDRNFALQRRGIGRFHNLFRSHGNELPFYDGHAVGAGILHASVLPSGSGVALSNGAHKLRVVAEDASGNRADVAVDILSDRRPRVLDLTAEPVADSVVIAGIVSDSDGDALNAIFELSSDEGLTWRGFGEERVPSGAVRAVLPGGYGSLYRLRVRDPEGLEAFQTGSPFTRRPGAADGTMLSCVPTFYSDFAVIQIDSDRSLAIAPRVVSESPGLERHVLEVRQTGMRTYETIARFDPRVDGPVRLVVSAVDADGNACRQWMTLGQHRVGPDGGVVRSDDGNAVARFGGNVVYETLFGRVYAEAAAVPEDLPMVGSAYRFSPADVPFRRGATLTLRYPHGLNRPERLAVYEAKGDRTWTFVGNRLDPASRTVSADVRHFSTYALLLDDIPPEVSALRSVSGPGTTDRRPILEASVRDRGSGIRREEDISVRLNDQRVIFEYDPEREVIRMRPRQPLDPGEYRFEVSARDMCGNQKIRSGLFPVR